MRILATAVGVVALAVLTVTVVARGSPSTAGCGRAFIPAYLPPDQLVTLSRIPGAGSFVILNPQSGPGVAAQPAYREAVEAMHAAGWRVLGYVPTGYGARSASAVRADASRFAAWYGVDGIFLDEAAASAEQLPYYQALRRDIKGLLAINPGIVPDRGYLAVADLIVTYEGPFAGYARAVAEAPTWLPRDRAVHLVYDAPAGSPLTAAGGGYSYATSATMPDPWSTLPAIADADACR